MHKRPLQGVARAGGILWSTSAQSHREMPEKSEQWAASQVVPPRTHHLGRKGREAVKRASTPVAKFTMFRPHSSQSLTACKVCRGARTSQPRGPHDQAKPDTKMHTTTSTPLAAFAGMTSPAPPPKNTARSTPMTTSATSICSPPSISSTCTQDSSTGYSLAHSTRELHCPLTIGLWSL